MRTFPSVVLVLKLLRDVPVLNPHGKNNVLQGQQQPSVCHPTDFAWIPSASAFQRDLFLGLCFNCANRVNHAFGEHPPKLQPMTYVVDPFEGSTAKKHVSHQGSFSSKAGLHVQFRGYPFW